MGHNRRISGELELTHADGKKLLSKEEVVM